MLHHVYQIDMNFLPFATSGLLREPKWGHLKQLHKAIKLCEPALVAGDPIVTSLGNAQKVRYTFRSLLSLRPTIFCSELTPP